MPTVSIPPGAVPASEPPSPLDLPTLQARLEKGDIGVLYQPIVRTHDRRPVMVEALARWPDGLPPVAPDVFLPMASRAGLMRPLSEAVIRAAARDIGRLRDVLGIGVTVNLPLEIIRQPDLPDWMRRVVEANGLHPTDMAIELTENATIHDPGELRRILWRLRFYGFQVFLDDIAARDPRTRLFDLGLKGLKLDRSLVLRLERSAATRRLVRQLAQDSDARGQVLVAEGVTDAGQLRLLAELGVHWAQGYLMSRPLPATLLRSWSEGWRAGRRP